jgi:general secretion pathway protein L
MTAVHTLATMLSRWLDRVAAAMTALIAGVAKTRTVRLVEGEDGHFTLARSDKGPNADLRGVALQIENGTIAGHPPRRVGAALKGSRIELVLRPDRFMFKPLELPSRAAEFLDGVVRAQIDRLTPWNAEHAAFGYSKPADIGSGRIVVTVAATAKALLAPLVKAFTGLGARAVMIITRAPEATPDAADITLVEENVAGVAQVRLARRILLVVLACALLISATAAIAATIIDGRLQARQDELARQIAQRRTAALAARNAPGDPKTLAERVLAQRKNKSPSAVIALEILSQILPDHTYVTELNIEGDKLRLTGITHNAPELIRLIQETGHFTQPTFFAPITRSPSDSGDRFNIEARMEPDFSLTP